MQLLREKICILVRERSNNNDNASFFPLSVPSYSRRRRVSLGKTTRCRRVLALQQALPAPFPWHESENADLTPRDKRGGVHLAPTRRHCKSEARFHPTSSWNHFRYPLRWQASAAWIDPSTCRLMPRCPCVPAHAHIICSATKHASLKRIDRFRASCRRASPRRRNKKTAPTGGKRVKTGQTATRAQTWSMEHRTEPPKKEEHHEVRGHPTLL